MATTDGDRRNGHRDPAEIQREIHETQARLSRTLTAIQEKLEPRRMMEQVTSMFRSSDGDTRRMGEMGDTMRDNALPLAMIGLGLGWLVWSNTRHPQADARLRQARHWAERRADDMRDYAREGMARMRAGEPHQGDEIASGTRTVPDRYRNDLGMAYGSEDYDYPGEYHYHEGGRSYAGQARDTIRDYADRARETVSEYTESARETLSDYAGRARGMMSGSSDRMHGAGRRAGVATRQYGEQIRSGAGNMWQTVEDHPMLSGAVGFLVGAAIGAAISPSRYEEEWLGDYRDAMVERGRQLGSETMTRATQVAMHAAEAGLEAAREAGREEAERQGLTTSSDRS